MPTPRYRVTGVPLDDGTPWVNGSTAFLPAFVRLAGSGAQHFKTLAGGPAQRTPVYNMSATTPSADLGDISQMGGARSSDAPDVFWPDQYIALPDRRYWPGAGMPIQMYEPTRPWNTTMVPVPAVNPSIALRQNQAAISLGVSSMENTRGMYDRAKSPSWRPRRRRGNGLASG